MQSPHSLFPTFFISGFECSTFRWKDRKRRDLVAETGHDRQVFDDYALLRKLGIAVAREGCPGPWWTRRGAATSRGWSRSSRP